GPGFEPQRTTWRSTSPVEMWQAPKRLASSFACVPFPAPGVPMMSSLSTRLLAPPPDAAALHEAFVAARDHVRLHRRHRVERHADDDQEGRAAEVEGHVVAADQDGRQHAYRGHVERARQRDARQDAVD